MVEKGWAVTLRHYGTDCGGAEQIAWQKGRDELAGTFINPWEWRCI